MPDHPVDEADVALNNLDNFYRSFLCVIWHRGPDIPIACPTPPSKITAKMKHPLSITSWRSVEVGMHMAFMIIIMKAKRLIQPYTRIQCKVSSLQKLFTAGVQDRHIVFFRQRADTVEKVQKVVLVSIIPSRCALSSKYLFDSSPWRVGSVFGIAHIFVRAMWSIVS